MTRIEEVDDIEHEKSEEQRKQEEEEELGARKAARRHDLRRPSEQERIEHEMTHLPFRSWCRHCIRRCGSKATEEERQVTQIHLDYMFMGDKKDAKTLAFWVARDRATRAVLSTVVPRKSTMSKA